MENRNSSIPALFMPEKAWDYMGMGSVGGYTIEG